MIYIVTLNVAVIIATKKLLNQWIKMRRKAPSGIVSIETLQALMRNAQLTCIVHKVEPVNLFK